jgi:hypothetical protein
VALKGSTEEEQFKVHNQGVNGHAQAGLFWSSRRLLHFISTLVKPDGGAAAPLVFCSAAIINSFYCCDRTLDCIP